MSGSIIYERSFEFAIKIVNLYKDLIIKKEFIMSKQLLRSGTSIGANVAEASAAYSKKDFISKMSIASKEARETKYWINLLMATNYLNEKDKYILNDINEIIKILTAIIKTSQEKERKYEKNSKFKT